MTVSIDGIVSQLDTTALIEASVAIQRAPMLILQKRADAYEKQQESVAGIRNRLVTLSETIRKMDSQKEFRAYAVFPQPSTFTIKANEGASLGTYAIRVDQLARSQSSSSQGFDTRDAALGSGTFSVTVGGVKTDLTVDASNDSLDAFAQSLDAVAGISAYVIDTGAATGRYKLMVQGDATGASNAITFDGSGLAWGDVPAFTTAPGSSAADAKIDLGGISLTSSTNKFTSAMPGIEIDLLSVSTTAETVTVSEDATAMRQKLADVVTAYNDLLAYQGMQTVFNPEAGISGPLFGEPTTRGAVSDVSDTLMNRFSVPGTDLKSLAQLGVKTERDGTLSFDTAVFDKVFAADPASVETFLTSATGPLTAVADRIDTLYVDSENGSLVSREESIESTIEQLNETIEASQERLDSLAARLRDQYTSMEILLGRVQTTESYLTSFFDSLTGPAK